MVQACPENLDGWRQLGRLCLSLRDFECARLHLERARGVAEETGLFEADLDLQEALAQARLFSGDLKGARDLLDALLTRDPSRTGALRNLSYIAERRGERSESAMLEMQALTIGDPTDSPAIEASPDVSESLIRQFQQAGVEVQAAHLAHLRLDGDSTDLAASRVLAFFDFRVARFEAAARLYQRVLRLAPESATALSERKVLAEAQRKIGRMEEARLLLEEVARREPEIMNNHFSLASLELESGRADRAVAIAERGLARDPRWGCLHYIRGAALQAQAVTARESERWRDAVRLLEESRASLLRAVADPQCAEGAAALVKQEEPLLDWLRKKAEENRPGSG